MNKDIIIADDERSWTGHYHYLAMDFGLYPITFNQLSDALGHLIDRKEAPAGYLIDMNPYPTSGPISHHGEQSPFPELIFKYAKKRGWTKNFYFVSTHLSEHDKKVLARTGAKFLPRESVKETLEKLANELK